jgi:hypothetical protein
MSADRQDLGESEMKNKKYSYALMACAIILVVSLSNLLAGCAKQQRGEVVEKICVPGVDKAGAMQIAEDVLVKMHFTIDKADPNTGFMRTRPLSGAQFFEFWREDNVGRENAALANLHTIRRVVELNVSPDEEKLCIGCDAQVYRLSLPQRESTSRALAPGMFSGSSYSLQVLQLRRPEQGQQAAWVNLGRDEELTTRILKRIEKRLVSQTGRESSILPPSGAAEDKYATGGEK